MNTQLLTEACSAGSLNPEDWIESFIELVASTIGNQDLLTVCQLASRGLDEEDRVEWMDNLIEFSVWETGRQSRRLELCDHLAREGLARFDSPKRWSTFGGLLHVACEAGSLDSIRWALERDPQGALRIGGSHGISALHSLSMHEDDDILATGIDLLMSRGADPDLKTRDGRNCLFRCGSPRAAAKLIGLGSDPWTTDSEGHNPVGFWLELGMWRCAMPAFQALPIALGAMQPWGSMSRLAMSKPAPLRDLPLFILACAPALRGREGEIERAEGLRALIELGADPMELDSAGRSLAERSTSPVAFALMEARLLTMEMPEQAREESSSRL